MGKPVLRFPAEAGRGTYQQTERRLTMALKRMVLEIGMGNDLHGGDYTKAAIRAV